MGLKKCANSPDTPAGHYHPSRAHISDVFERAGGCGLESGRNSQPSGFKVPWLTWNFPTGLQVMGDIVVTSLCGPGGGGRFISQRCTCKVGVRRREGNQVRERRKRRKIKMIENLVWTSHCPSSMCGLVDFANIQASCLLVTAETGWLDLFRIF